MKKLNLLLIFLALYATGIASVKEINRVQSFNQSWKFTLADSTMNAYSVSFYDTKWRSLMSMERGW